MKNITLRHVLIQLPEDLDHSLKYATGSAKQVLTNAIELCEELDKPHF